MVIDEDQLATLLAHPSESLNVEVKTWIDPSRPDGISKIIRAVFALHNRNGGYLIFGFDNRTLRPDDYPFQDNVEATYHVDVLQRAVSRYASKTVNLVAAYREAEGQVHPILIVPDGVRVPLVVKRDLIGDGGKYLLREGDVYFRTLTSNGTPSTARIGVADWPDLMEICFENREADIGRFFRRHLAGREYAGVVSLLTAGSETEKKSKLRSQAEDALKTGFEAFTAQVLDRGLSPTATAVLSGLAMSVGLAIEPQREDALPTEEFLNKVFAGNPRYTGWPIWLDSRNFRNEEDRPRVKAGAWQALVVSLEDGWGRHLDFMRFDPRGTFYLHRLMQDDLSDRVEPGAALDVVLMIYRVTEVLATGISITRSAGWDESARAGFALQWSSLAGRRLRSWVNPLRGSGSGNEAADDAAAAYVELSLDTPHSALAPHVERAVRPLFANFNGYSPDSQLIEDSVQKVIERRMND